METISYHISTMEELRDLNKWVKTVRVSTHTGFLRYLLIRVCIATGRGKDLLIDFYFSHKSYYTSFKRVLRQLETRRG